MDKLETGQSWQTKEPVQAALPTRAASGQRWQYKLHLHCFQLKIQFLTHPSHILSVHRPQGCVLEYSRLPGKFSWIVLQG